MSILEKTSLDEHNTSNQQGPWKFATSVKVEDLRLLEKILKWCRQCLRSSDWAWQLRNHFAHNEAIFYFNDNKDYIFFMLKYIK